MAGTLDLEPLSAKFDTTFGVVAHGLRVTDLDEATFRELYAAWLKYALLVIPGQFLGRGSQIAFAKRFGPLEFEMSAIGNVKSDGTLRHELDVDDDVVNILKGNMGWHCDSTFKPIQATGAVFSAEVVPSHGGHTGFADMRAAYDALDDSMRQRIETLSAHHSLLYSQQKLGHKPKEGTDTYRSLGFQGDTTPLRPLVKVHPETGRKSLLVGRHAHNIPGLDPAESERLLQELVDFACQPPRIYHHDWAAGDVVVWDNRCLLHRATPWDMKEPRVMWHTRIAGNPVSEAALA